MSYFQRLSLLIGSFTIAAMCVFVPWREGPAEKAQVMDDWPMVRELFVKAFPNIAEDEIQRRYEDARHLRLAKSGFVGDADRGYGVVWRPPEATGPARQCDVDYQRMVPPIVAVFVVFAAVFLVTGSRSSLSNR